MEAKLRDLLDSIEPLNESAMTEARLYQLTLVKPPESLGRLEDLSIQLAGITGELHNEVARKHLLVFASDNGIVEAEPVASAPQSVTRQLALGLTRGRTGAAVLCRRFGCELTVCDVGVNGEIQDPAVLNKKIAFGTGNIAAGPAMSREQAVQAILTGAELARNTQADLLGVGEVGIGNTTTSAAVLAVLLGKEPEAVTGRGAGVSDAHFRVKKDAIRRAIDLNQPDAGDVVDVLAKVGGFDIAAMCGAFLGAAASHRPVVIDGFISVVAALCAARLCYRARDYMIPSHASWEIGYDLAIRELRLKPMLALDMRLGEGSGCPLAFQLVEAACAIINDVATFAQAGVEDDYMEQLGQGDNFTVKPEEE